jgi:hypothetical protein
MRHLSRRLQLLRRLLGRPGLALVLTLILAPVHAMAATAPQHPEDFFIVSSLDAARGRMVLKRPTEVTLVMHVDGQTTYRDERGQPLALRDLRTGDTVYIAYQQAPGGEPTALRVRRGPMTVAELQRRYLHPDLPPGSPARPGGGMR